MYVGKICSALKTIDPGLTGTGKQLPHSSEDSRQACKLWCEKETTLRSWPDMYFPDGTLCHMDGYTAAFCLKVRTPPNIHVPSKGSSLAHKSIEVDFVGRLVSEKESTVILRSGTLRAAGIRR